MTHLLPDIPCDDPRFMLSLAHSGGPDSPLVVITTCNGCGESMPWDQRLEWHGNHYFDCIYWGSTNPNERPAETRHIQPNGVVEGRRSVTADEYDGTQYFWIFPTKRGVTSLSDRSWSEDEITDYLSAPGQFPNGNGDMMGDNYDADGDPERVTDKIRCYASGLTIHVTQMFYPPC